MPSSWVKPLTILDHLDAQGFSPGQRRVPRRIARPKAQVRHIFVAVVCQSSLSLPQATGTSHDVAAAPCLNRLRALWLVTSADKFFEQAVFEQEVVCRSAMSRSICGIDHFDVLTVRVLQTKHCWQTTTVPRLENSDWRTVMHVRCTTPGSRNRS